MFTEHCSDCTRQILSCSQLLALLSLVYGNSAWRLAVAPSRRQLPGDASLYCGWRETQDQEALFGSILCV